MIHFSPMKQRTLILWTLLLSLALICTQGVKLHVHNLDHDHDHDQRHSHTTVDAASEHSHLSKAHLSIDITHSDHHDETVSELDNSSYGLLKKVFNNVLTLAILVTVFSLLLPSFCQQTFLYRRDKKTNRSWRYLFSPPLRAPPL